MERKSIINIIVFTFIILFALGNFTYATNATNVTGKNGIKAEIGFYNALIENKKSVVISILTKTKNEITKEELLSIYEGNKITDVKNANGTSLANTDKVKTLDKAVTADGEYDVILVGDSNCDGTICDTDDIMTIINDYLGKNILSGEKKIAANLINSDNVLDIDDILQMINRYLGKVENLIKQSLPVESTETIIVTPLNTSLLVNQITAADYGKKIDNYSVTVNDVILNDWRLFYSDETGIDIIYADYLPTGCIKSGIGIEGLDPDGLTIKTTEYFLNTQRAEEIAVISSGLSTTSNWDEMVRDDLRAAGKATATGGPTFKLFADSWNSNPKTNTTTITVNTAQNSLVDGTTIMDSASRGLYIPYTDDNIGNNYSFGYWFTDGEWVLDVYPDERNRNRR